MKIVIKILCFVVLALVAYGYYQKNTGLHAAGDKCVGIGVLVAAFILMPLFIYHRWKGKNVKDYMLTEENIHKMKEYNQNKSKRDSYL